MRSAGLRPDGREVESGTPVRPVKTSCIFLGSPATLGPMTRGAGAQSHGGPAGCNCTTPLETRWSLTNVSCTARGQLRRSLAGRREGALVLGEQNTEDRHLAATSWQDQAGSALCVAAAFATRHPGVALLPLWTTSCSKKLKPRTRVGPPSPKSASCRIRICHHSPSPIPHPPFNQWCRTYPLSFFGSLAGLRSPCI